MTNDLKLKIVAQQALIAELIAELRKHAEYTSRATGANPPAFTLLNRAAELSMGAEKRG